MRVADPPTPHSVPVPVVEHYPEKVTETAIIDTAKTINLSTTPNPGEYKVIDGEEYWVEPDGYAVKRKFVLLYPGWYGPLAQDPDHGEGNVECNDALSGVLAKLQGYAKWNESVKDYNGMYSTWSERHCSEGALAIAEDIKSSADVPPCPKFWLQETHYWVTHIAIGRTIDKKVLAEAMSSTVTGLLQNKKVLALLGTAAAAGAAVLPTLLQAALTLIGVTT